jgi:uncharacterized membrane protein YkoI
MKFHAWIVIVLLCSPALGFAGESPFQLRGKGYHEAPMMRLAAAAQLSASQAASKVKQRYGGKVLSVTLSQNGGKPVYRVKVLTKSGVMKIVLVDGVSGRVYE